MFITGSCAEFQWPELLDRPDECIYVATAEFLDLRAGATRRYQSPQDHSLPVQEFLQEMSALYIKEAPTPFFGLKDRWRRLEFAKSRGEIHFLTLAICEGKQSHSLLYDMEGGGSRDIAYAIAKWARGALRPADSPGAA